MSEIESKLVINEAVIDGLAKFDQSALKPVQYSEKNNLPSQEDIASEKKHLDFVNGVQKFNRRSLKPTVTEEKIVLPDKEQIENERLNKSETKK